MMVHATPVKGVHVKIVMAYATDVAWKESVPSIVSNALFSLHVTKGLLYAQMVDA